MTTDTSEKGLEALIVDSLVNEAGYERGSPKDFDRDHCVDLPKLLGFLQATQPEKVSKLDIGAEGPKRTKFLARLTGEISKRGVIDVLRKGVSDGPVTLDLFYPTAHPDNAGAVVKFAQNVFSVTRQVHFSPADTALSLDVVVFINGLPLATFELKNSLTKQTVDDAVQQYKNDRDAKERLFQLGRCLVHLAVDDHEVRFCTHLQDKRSVFLPFNKGYNDGAGNPPNPSGLKTDYLWKEILTKASLTDIVENYAELVQTKDHKTGAKKSQQIFPRYHQLDVVRKLLSDVSVHGVGKRYLIQHSAGSGKSNSIAWLAHQLVGQYRNGKAVFDSVIVITDRRVLDEQIRETIRKFAQVSAVIGAVGTGADSKTKQLTQFLADGKKIIISTVQTFPYVLDEIGGEHRGRSFAIIIDEAHSSQGSRTSAKLNMALSADPDANDEDSVEDKINAIIEQKKMLQNASYFAFTATPKNKTLEVFGEAYSAGEVVKHRPFHAYTMKQAIEEGFILDVLRHYTPVESYYKLIATVSDDPEFDVKKANKKLRAFVEKHDHAIRSKAEIMIDHFHDHVIAKKKIGGEARAMVITGSIQRAIQYCQAFREYLTELKSPYKAIVAFSGEHEFPEGSGNNVTEASLNGFPSSQITSMIQQHPYRFLICADKFQTGYDEPLLHTMYVDKQLSGIKAVQTLSRLNRSCPQKWDTFVLDFSNDPETIRASFDDYYRTTLLSSETDPNKLHDLKAALDGAQVYSLSDIDTLVTRFLDKQPRDQLDPVLDKCVALYTAELDEDAQVDFKGKAKAFLRTYGFLSSVLPYANASWEKLSIFLNFLVPKLPAPREEDLSKGILDAIDMDSYRNEVKAELDIVLSDANAEIDPVPTAGGGRKPEPELDRLSNIVKFFNEHFGNIDWKDKDKIQHLVTVEIPQKVAADPAYRNAIANSDRENAKLEHNKALERVIQDLIGDHLQLYGEFSDNASFRNWLQHSSFVTTYGNPAA